MQLGSNVVIDAATSGGVFAGPVPGFFGGVDISAFEAKEPLFGSFFQFALKDTVFLNGGTDVDVNAEITAVIPLPAAAWGGMALFGLLGGAKLRRSRQGSLV